MTFPQSGVAAHTSQTINTTTAQATTQVLAPSYNPTGTALGTGGATMPTGTASATGGGGLWYGGPPTTGLMSFVGPVTYPLLYGSAAAQLNTVSSIPAQNGYMGANAQALTSTSANTVNGLAPYGAAQGIAQNQAARPDVYINNTFDFIYQQLLTMANYSYRM